MKESRVDWRMLFQAVRMSFDPRKLLIGAGVLLGGVILLSPGLRLALLLNNEGERMRNPWGWGWEVCQGHVSLSLGAMICLAFLSLAVWSLLQFGVCAIARIAVLEKTRPQGSSLASAMAFSRRHLRTLILSPVPFAIVAGLPLAVISVAGLLGNLPVIGPILMGVLAAPSVLLSGFSLFVALLWLFTFPWLPAVIAVEGSDVLDAAGKLVNLAFRGPQGLLGHGILMLILGILLSGAWIALVATATQVGVGCLLRPVVAPWGHAQDLAAAARGLGWVCACDHSPVSSSSFVAQLALLLVKISVGAMGLIALGYPLVFWGCSTPLSYRICRYHLDRVALEKVVEDADEVMPDLPSRRPEGG